MSEFCPRCDEPMRELACVECHVCDTCSPAWDGIGSCHEKRPAEPGFPYDCTPMGARLDHDDD